MSPASSIGARPSLKLDKIIVEMALEIERPAIAFGAGIVACALTASCSALVSFDDLVGSASGDAASPADGASPKDASADAPSDAPSVFDAPGSDASSALALVQIATVDAQSHEAVFPNETTAGNFLVAMEPVSTPAPVGGAWQAVTSSDGSDVMYIWPNNPGGLKSVVASMYNTIILVEFSGVSTSATVDFEKDTGGRGASVSTLSLTGATPSASGELVLLYLDSTAGVPAPLDGWGSLGTDNQNNFAWWTVSTEAAPSATAEVSPSSPTSMLMIAMKM